jgi:hypothetical protein
MHEYMVIEATVPDASSKINQYTTRHPFSIDQLETHHGTGIRFYSP